MTSTHLIKKCISFSMILCTSLVFQACDDNKDNENDNNTKNADTGNSDDNEDTNADATDDDDSAEGPETGLPVDMPSTGDCGNTCDIFVQDCPEGTACKPKACMPDNQETGIWDTDVCIPAGQRAVGEECTRPGTAELETECMKGAMCWGGVCQATCTGSIDDAKCEMGNTCLIGNDGVLAVCLPACDPLAPACAGPTDVCLPAGDDPDGFICIPKAGDPDSGKWGDPCPCRNCCQAGLNCVSGPLVDKEGCLNEESCCAQFCDMSKDEPCPGAMEKCEPVFDTEKPGYENVGICIIPQ